MTGIRLDFSLNDVGLRKELRDQVRRLQNQEPLLKNIAEHFRAEIPDRFREERGPDGKWEPLAPATIENRRRKYGDRPITILRAEGELYGSIVYQTTRSSLTIGTRAGSIAEDYAALQNFGGQAGPGHAVTVPARAFLGFSDSDINIIAEEIEAFLMGE